MPDPTALNLRTLLLLLLTTAPEFILRFRQELIILWKTIRAKAAYIKQTPDKKKSKFWEIDMTKFEP